MRSGIESSVLQRRPANSEAGTSSSCGGFFGACRGSGGGFRISRTASAASVSVMHFLSSVCTERYLIQGVPATLTLSAQAKSRSSKATQAVTSGWALSQSPISRARRSHQARIPLCFWRTGFGLRTSVLSRNWGMSWLFSTALMDDLSSFVRLHSEESTIMAPVCCTMERRLPSAEMEKSLSLTARIGRHTPSITMVSTLPDGRRTPSTSRKMTRVGSSVGSFGRLKRLFSTWALAAASLAGSGGGRNA
mmetsp:Transcript_59782/g.129503  ORF Transcript_59782/g.129503 Transcript_59782/m.129503 type:complete len:249 (-) Transcript_59782:95-841(-)